MYILNIASITKKMSVNEIRDFIFENYYKKFDFLKKTVIIQWNIRKKDLQLSVTKSTEKIPDPHNAKEHYQSIATRKNTKSIKQ